MEKFAFNTGVKEYPMPGGVLRFNPKDPNVYDRFIKATEKISTVEKEFYAKAQETDDWTGLMRDLDLEMKAILSEAFGYGNDFDALMNGESLAGLNEDDEFIVSAFIKAIQPILEAGAKSYADAKVNTAKLNREERRALNK